MRFSADAALDEDEAAAFHLSDAATLAKPSAHAAAHAGGTQSRRYRAPVRVAEGEQQVYSARRRGGAVRRRLQCFRTRLTARLLLVVVVMGALFCLAEVLSAIRTLPQTPTTTPLVTQRAINPDANTPPVPIPSGTAGLFRSGGTWFKKLSGFHYPDVYKESDYDAVDTELGSAFATLVANFSRDPAGTTQHAVTLLEDFFKPIPAPPLTKVSADETKFYGPLVEHVLGARVGRALFSHSPFRIDGAPPRALAYRHWLSRLVLLDIQKQTRFPGEQPTTHRNNALLKDSFDSVEAVLDTGGAMFAEFYSSLVGDDDLSALYHELFGESIPSTQSTDTTPLYAARHFFEQAARRVVRANVDAMRLVARSANLLLNAQLQDYAARHAGAGGCPAAVSERLRARPGRSVLSNAQWVELLMAHVARRGGGAAAPTHRAELNCAVSYLALHTIFSDLSGCEGSDAFVAGVGPAVRRLRNPFASADPEATPGAGRNALVLLAALQDPEDHFTLRGSFFFTAAPQTFTSCHSHYRTDESSEGGRFLCNEEYLAPTDAAAAPPGGARVPAHLVRDASFDTAVVSAGSNNQFAWEAGLLAFLRQQRGMVRRVDRVLTLDCTLAGGLVSPSYLAGLAVVSGGVNQRSAIPASGSALDDAELPRMQLVPFCLGVGANNFADLAPLAGFPAGAALGPSYPLIDTKTMSSFKFTAADNVLHAAIHGGDLGDAPSSAAPYHSKPPRRLVIFKMDIENDDYRALDNWITSHHQYHRLQRAQGTAAAAAAVLPALSPAPRPEIFMSELHSEMRLLNPYGAELPREFLLSSGNSPARRELTHALLLKHRALLHLHGFGYLLHTVENNPQTAACAELTHSRQAYFAKSETLVALHSLARDEERYRRLTGRDTFADFVDAKVRALLGDNFLELFLAKGGVAPDSAPRAHTQDAGSFQVFVLERLGVALTRFYQRLRGDAELARLYDSLLPGAGEATAVPLRLARFSLAVDKVLRTLGTATNSMLSVVYSVYHPSNMQRGLNTMMELYKQHNNAATAAAADESALRHSHFDPLFMVLRHLAEGGAGIGKDLSSINSVFDECVLAESRNGTGTGSPVERCRARAVVPRKFSPQYTLRRPNPATFLSGFAMYEVRGKPSFLETFPVTCHTVIPLITSPAARDGGAGVASPADPLREASGVGRDDTVVDLCNGEHLLLRPTGAAAATPSEPTDAAVPPVVAVVQSGSPLTPMRAGPASAAAASAVAAKTQPYRWRAAAVDGSASYDYVAVVYNDRGAGAAGRVLSDVCTLAQERRGAAGRTGYRFTALTLNLRSADGSEAAVLDGLLPLLRAQGVSGAAPVCGGSAQSSGEAPFYLFPILQFNMNFNNGFTNYFGNVAAQRMAAGKLLDVLAAGYLPYRTAALQIHSRQQIHFAHYRFFIESETDSLA